MAKFGINNVVIAIKPGKEMHCFHCNGLFHFKKLNLGKLSIPLCKTCYTKFPKEITDNYMFNKRPTFSKRVYSKEKYKKGLCQSCQSEYKVDPIFDDYNFSKRNCMSCLKNSENSIKNRNLNVKYENNF